MTADPGRPDPFALEAELLGQLGWVRRLAASLVRDGDAAADIAQDVAGEWVARRPAWAERGLGLRRWLHRATRSCSVDHLRAERARRRRERAATTPPADDDALGVLERLERQQRVAAAVRELPEPYRSTLLHRYLDELPTRGVAECMGVTEATVRKRIERGLEMLRTRLDGEFGMSSRAWALALLGPRWPFGPADGPAQIGMGGEQLTAIMQGAGFMASKKLVVATGSMVLAAIAALWYANATVDSAPVEAGGRGVIVPASVAARRDSGAVSPERVEVAAKGAEGPAMSLAAAPTIRGYVFVDEQPVAPADLAIALEQRGPGFDAELQVQIDIAAGAWLLRPPPNEPLTLWVTSASTVPAQIPVPAELLHNGGVFDLYLLSGRSLSLLFLDEVSRAPLADLEFVLGKAIELQRGGGRVVTRGSVERHRTDRDGRAVLLGIPEVGHLSVTTDVATRVRNILMRDGGVLRAHQSGEPIWSLPLDASMPRRLEQTILTRAPLGEAWAKGQLPAWARSRGQDEACSVRVVARRWSDQPRERGDAFALDQDEAHCFVLREQAPQQFRVWLEGSDREPISAPTLVAFDHQGEHAPIVLQPVDATTVRVHCTHVPARGQLELIVSGPDTPARVQQVACAGEPLTLEVTAAAGEQLRLALRAGSARSGKTAWQRQLVVDPGQPEMHVDLTGSFLDVRIETDVVEMLGEAAVSLMACRSSECSADERIVVLLVDGSSSEPVFVPAGRWLFTYSSADAGTAWPHAVWGVVDVPGAGTELSLRPRLHLVPRHELQAGLRFDEVDGVSLRALPERLRTWQPAAEGEPVAMPVGAVHTPLAAPR